MTISAADVKALREASGAGMMDCKRALQETNGDMEEARDWLRKKGLAAAQKKSSRVAAEGLIGVVVDGNVGAVLEVNSETDFVARNEAFQKFVSETTQLVLEHGDDLDNLNGVAYPGTGRNVAEELTHLVATIGENMHIRRAQRLTVENGLVTSYVHNKVADGLGKIGVLTALEGGDDLTDLGRHIAMHVAAAAPLSLSREDLSEAAVQREREIFKEQALQSGKPAEVVDKMIEGRIRKFYQESVLLEQVSMIDGENKIEKLVEKAGSQLTGFTRYQLGEGVEKKEEDFAAEVAAQANR